MLKSNKQRKPAPRFVQRACITSSYQNALDMFYLHFDNVGYIFWFGSFWAIYSR